MAFQFCSSQVLISGHSLVSLLLLMLLSFSSVSLSVLFFFFKVPITQRTEPVSQGSRLECVAVTPPQCQGSILQIASILAKLAGLLWLHFVKFFVSLSC